MTYGREELEYTELWELPATVTQEEFAQAWSAVIEEWEPVVAAADLNWNGSEFAVLHGERARQVLVVLQRFAATSAVHKLFDAWYESRDASLLTRAQQIADEAAATMRSTALSEAELGGELSGMLSRAGFLKSLDDQLLPEARTALEDALRTGDADSWVTKWNLANVAARQGDHESALALLRDIDEAVEGWSGHAFILFFARDRGAADSLLRVTDVGVGPLLELQRAIIAAGAGMDADLLEPLESCRISDDAAARAAAAWLDEALATAAQADEVAGP